MCMLQKHSGLLGLEVKPLVKRSSYPIFDVKTSRPIIPERYVIVFLWGTGRVDWDRGWTKAELMGWILIAVGTANFYIQLGPRPDMPTVT